MGNIFCPTEDVTNMASFARDVCPWPDYSISPHFVNMMSINSSLHLGDHYAAVQSSLTPQQLGDFTQSLRTTFGRDGNVTLGGVGVVALSLAVLFDTLARQVRGEWVSESGPIPGLFIKDRRGYYPPQVYTVSEYLRLVPHMANYPKRMKYETERCHKQLMAEDRSLDKLWENPTLPIMEDITTANLFLTYFFAVGLKNHYHRIKNTMENDLITLERKQPQNIIFTFNCDTDTAEIDILAEVQKSDEHIQKYFENMLKGKDEWLRELAKQDMVNEILHLTCSFESENQRENFDLKANALGTWPE